MNLNQAILRLAHKKTMMKPVSKKNLVTLD